MSNGSEITEGRALRNRCHLVALGLVLLLAVPFGLSAQENDCPTGPGLLSTSEPVYPDAVELKQTLESHGFVVRCMFPTTLWSIFVVGDEGGGPSVHSTVEGQVNFSTNYGDVQAVFLPKPQTFANFGITEHREEHGFLYTFSGTPRVWDANRFGTAYRVYFLDHENQLFFIGDVKLLRRLEKVLGVRHRKL